MFARLVSSSLLGLCFSTQAATTLQAELNAFQTFSADIQQTMVVEGVQQELRGVIKIKRPHHFYWQVTEPYNEKIVSNGKTIWQYEPDLEQVIVQAVGQELQGIPLMLLSGDVTDIETLFHVHSVEDGRFELIPQGEDDMVKRIYLDFKAGHLASLEVENTLGQTIYIVFTHVVYDAVLDNQLFEFTVPPGVEIVENLPR